MATVAVVIPSYNHANYIAAALESAVGQTLAPERVVVVDDGSTDGSVEAIRAFGHPKVTLLTQANAGAHRALNRGIEAAGPVDYIAILNSDDLFEPQRLERCVAYLEANPGREVVCTGLRMIDAEGAFLPPEDPKARRTAAVWADPARDPAEWLGLANFAKTTSNFVIRAGYARAHPLRDYRYAHDLFFAVTAAVEGKFGVLPEPLLRYRTHATNTIKRDGAARVAWEVTRLNLDLLRELGPRLAESPEVRAAYTRYFRTLAGNHADFRAEVFFALAAQRLAGVPEGGEYPELSAPPSREMAIAADLARLRRFHREAARSRWLALGTALGVLPDLFADFSGKELAALQKRLGRSRWVRLGRALGLTPFPL